MQDKSLGISIFRNAFKAAGTGPFSTRGLDRTLEIKNQWLWNKQCFMGKSCDHLILQILIYGTIGLPQSKPAYQADQNFNIMSELDRCPFSRLLKEVHYYLHVIYWWALFLIQPSQLRFSFRHLQIHQPLTSIHDFT